MQVLHIVPEISAEAAGPSYSVPRLCTALVDEGQDVSLHVLAEHPVRLRLVEGVRVYEHSAWPVLRSLGISPSMVRELFADSTRADIVHNHSLWMLPNAYPAWLLPFRKAALVSSPRGTLSPVALKRSRISKAAFYSLIQFPTIRYASCLHATSDAEYADIREFGYRGPVAVVPNGIDIQAETAHYSNERRRLLYLGRLHPIKGLEKLLRAWRALQETHLEWELRLVGPAAVDYGRQLEALARDLRCSRVTFLGPVYGAEKWREYRGADLFVLPSLSENFGVSVAEALSVGVPAVVTKAAPWSGLETHRCGWWVEGSVDSLVGALGDAMSLPRDTLRSRGADGRRWASSEFAWQSVASKMVGVYNWIKFGGQRPGCVHLA